VSGNIIDAYKWLIDNYEDGDEIFIFGFSRGAYTARALSGLISICGLLKLGCPISIKELYNRYKKGQPNVRTIKSLIEDRDAKRDNFTILEKRILQYSRDIPIKFVGVWDTVGAILRSARFLNTGVRRSNEFCFHAVAIDENRWLFRPTLWSKKTPKGKPEVPPRRSLAEVEQRWFVGAHGNVGGGCYSDFLVDIPFRWMMEKAELHGLAFREEVAIEPAACDAKISDSFREFLYGVAYVVRFGIRYYRPIGAAPTRAEGDEIEYTINETIDASVFERWQCNKSYRPRNLRKWAKRYGVNIDELRKSVRADAPAETV
jgi:uncharacterized protein (DUF2235 family)